MSVWYTQLGMINSTRTTPLFATLTGYTKNSCCIFYLSPPYLRTWQRKNIYGQCLGFLLLRKGALGVQFFFSLIIGATTQPKRRELQCQQLATTANQLHLGEFDHKNRERIVFMFTVPRTAHETGTNHFFLFMTSMSHHTVSKMMHFPFNAIS